MTDTEFTRLVGLLRDNIFRIAFCYMKSYADADDVTQDAFLKLYRYDGGFATDADAKAWLIRVAINRSKDLLKSRWYRLSEPIDEEAAASDLYAGEDGGLLAAVMKIKPKNRTVLYMHYYEEYSVREIAELLHITESAVTTRLMRGRGQLRDLLIKEGYDYAE